jgi:penicillin-binding protein 2
MLLSPRREVGEFRKRYKWMGLVAVIVFSVLIGRIIQLQAVQHDEWAARAQENITKTIPLPATRGVLRDTAGRVVATNRPSYMVYVTPQLMTPEHVNLFADLMNLSGEERRAFERRLREVPNRRRTHQIEFFDDIDREQLAALETHQNELPGVDVVSRPVRTYPYGALGAHMIGYVNEVSADDYVVYAVPEQMEEEHVQRLSELLELEGEARRELFAKLSERSREPVEVLRPPTPQQFWRVYTSAAGLPGVDLVAEPLRSGRSSRTESSEESPYRPGSVVGRMGLEAWGERFLRGRAGYRRMLVDATGRRQMIDPRLARSREEHQPPQPGMDLVLSIDMELMNTLKRAFAGHPSGAAVVVDVNGGRVRGLYSKPSYDLNGFIAGLSHEEYHELESNPFRPLIDKTLYESYFPGSTFKPVSALAGLAMDDFDPNERVECIGYYEIGTDRKRCTSAHGEVDMNQALVQSCNVYFYHLAEQVGLERLNDWARRFGLASRTGIGINSESSGFLASREWYEEHYGRYRVGYTLNTAIGQGNTRATLLQLALAYGALANGGTLWAPQIVESIREPDGTLVEEFPTQVRRDLEVPPEHMELVTRSLFGVVNAQSGTAYDARIERGVTVSGKTGTAEIAPGRPRTDIDPDRAWYFNRSHAWFAGYAPAEDPQVAIVIIVEHGGAGGRAAAPIAMQVLQEYLGGQTTAAVTASADDLARRGRGG